MNGEMEGIKKYFSPNEIQESSRKIENIEYKVWIHEKTKICLLEINEPRKRITQEIIRYLTKEEDAFVSIIYDCEHSNYIVYSPYFNGKSKHHIIHENELRSYVEDVCNRPTSDICGEIKKIIGEYGISIDENDIVFYHNRVVLSPKCEYQLLVNVLKHFSENVPTIGCRYMSISSFYRLFGKAIKTDKDFSLEQSMCCVLGMNDKGECSSKKSEALRKKVATYNMNTNEVFNDYFIMSLCNAEDDLTMWRLYGGNGKGVCIKYDWLADETNKAPFYLYPVFYYGDKAYNEILNILSSLLGLSFRSKHFVYYFSFMSFDNWLFFLKKANYKGEKEIRLLYNKSEDSQNLANIKWVLNDTYGVFHPIAIFKNSTTFPLKITEITLGPKISEAEVNKDQLKSLLKVDVKLSKIKDYR